MFEVEQIESEAGKRTEEYNGGGRGGGKKKHDLLTEKFLMKWKAQEIENGQDNMTEVKLVLEELQKEMQGLHSTTWSVWI